MTDSLAAQREARRLKLMKNAESRLNRLRDRPQHGNEAGGPPSPDIELKKIDTKVIDRTDEVRTTSPYNLRHRTNQGSPKSEENKESPETKSSVPYEIVDDPEVPSLAEFLATQKPTTNVNNRPQAPNPNVSFLPPKTKDGYEKIKRLQKKIEYIRVIGLFLTALMSRWLLTYQFDFNVFVLGAIFQSMFFPFVVFEVLISFAIQAFAPGVPSTPPQGSLLTTALMLCGIKAELVQLYLIIMSRVTTLSNDLFLYIFAFISWHILFGSLIST